MTIAELLNIADKVLTNDEFQVWVTKHVAGKGRRSGSLALCITEEAFRYRLTSAERKIIDHIERQTA